MIKITKFTNKHKASFIKLLEDLQDHIIEIDPLKRFVRLPAYGKRYADELIKQIKKQNGAIYIAEQENIPVGVIVGIVEELTENDLQECVPSKLGTIIQLIVDHNHRGKKIGSLLINEMEEYFRSQKCDVSYIDVIEPNKMAREFYQKKGYSDRVITLIKKIT